MYRVALLRGGRFLFFFFNDTAPTEIYPLSLHDALPICVSASQSTVTAAPASIPAGGSSTITVTARDAGGNPMGGASVSLTATGGTGNPLPPASFFFNDTAAAEIYTLTLHDALPISISATINTVAITQTASVTVTAGTVSATTSTVEAAPASIPAGHGTSTMTGTAREAGRNPVGGASGRLHATGGARDNPHPARRHTG